MKKVTLSLEQLSVESFPTTDAPWERRGTVRGMDSATVDQDTCDTCDRCSDMDTCVSCVDTCPVTCASCPLSCYPEDCPSSDGRC